MITYNVDGVRMPDIKKREHIGLDKGRGRHLRPHGGRDRLYVRQRREDSRSEPRISGTRLLHRHHHLRLRRGRPQINGDIVISASTRYARMPSSSAQGIRRRAAPRHHPWYPAPLRHQRQRPRRTRNHGSGREQGARHEGIAHGKSQGIHAIFHIPFPPIVFP
jgi:hypothetical protein